MLKLANSIQIFKVTNKFFPLCPVPMPFFIQMFPNSPSSPRASDHQLSPPSLPYYFKLPSRCLGNLCTHVLILSHRLHPAGLTWFVWVQKSSRLDLEKSKLSKWWDYEETASGMEEHEVVTAFCCPFQCPQGSATDLQKEPTCLSPSLHVRGQKLYSALPAHGLRIVFL